MAGGGLNPCSFIWLFGVFLRPFGNVEFMKKLSNLVLKENIAVLQLLHKNHNSMQLTHAALRPPPPQQDKGCQCPFLKFSPAPPLAGAPPPLGQPRASG